MSEAKRIEDKLGDAFKRVERVSQGPITWDGKCTVAVNLGDGTETAFRTQPHVGEFFSHSADDIAFLLRLYYIQRDVAMTLIEDPKAKDKFDEFVGKKFFDTEEMKGNPFMPINEAKEEVPRG